MPPVFDPSEEKTNCTRLLRLLIDGGTYVLKEFLHFIHPPTTLQAVFRNNVGRLNYLRFTAKPKIITKNQWEKLFPTSGDPPDSETFDITLLHLLLREVCCLKAPSKGWHDLPADSDVSCEANIVRIKYYRNELCHMVSTGISKCEFDDKWNVISLALVALGMDQKEVDRLKTAPIDHDTERLVEEEVKKWKLEFEPRVENLEKWKLETEPRVENLEKKMSYLLSEKTTHELPDCLPDEVEEVFGRSQEIQLVTQAVLTGNVATVVITGGPGFGKTAVANKVGHELAANREIQHAVLFCPLRLKTAVDEVATSMILTCSKSHSKPPENPQHWLRNWSKQQQQKVTFILDNVDDVLELADRPAFLSMLCDMRMLSKHNVTFVITTRKIFRDSGLKIKEVRLEQLPTEEAKKLLVSKFLDEDSQDTQQMLSKAKKLVELCGCVPLALCIVGSLLSDYKEDELIKILEEKPMDVLREDGSDENSVEKAIKTSFDFLSKNEQEALVLMSALPGSFSSDAVQELITSSCPEPLLVLRSLKNRSLVEKPASDRYQIHQLIQAFAKKIDQAKYYQGEQEAFHHFISCLANNASMYWSKDKCKDSIEAFNEDRHNFEYFLQFYVQASNHQNPTYLMPTLRTLVEKFSQKSLYLEMCLLPSVYVKLLEEWHHLLMSDQQPVSKIVELLCLLGHENRKVGNQNKCEQFLVEAMKLHTENPEEFDQEKVSEAFFRNNYARFLSEQRNFSGAKEQLDIGLKVCEGLSPIDYVQKGVTLLFSGREDNRQNKRDEAEKKLNEALKLFQENLGTHVMTALILRNLADFHLFHGEKSLGSQEDWQRAIQLYEQCLEMMEHLGIKDHRVCILTLTNFGICHQLEDKFEEAMKLYQDSLNIAERELAENHRWKIYEMTQMAYWYYVQGNIMKAQEWKDKAMQMSEALVLPETQPPNKFLLQKIETLKEQPPVTCT